MDGNSPDIDTSTIYFGGEDESIINDKNWLSIMFMIMLLFGLFVCIIRRITTYKEASCHTHME